MRKNLFFVFITAIIFLFIACNNDAPGTNDSNIPLNDVDNENGAETPAEPEELKPDLPDLDMNGKEMKILTADWWGYSPFDFVDIDPEGYNGEVLNDAAYERKLKIEQQYNIQIKQTEMPLVNAADSLRNAVMAGDDAYDIAFIRGWNISGLLSGNNYLLNLAEFPHVNFDMPWWKKDAYDAFAIGGKNYGVIGSMSTNDMMTMWGLCFNKEMVKDYGFESPYSLFQNGDWTYDRVVEMAKTVSRDLDGDGIMTKDDLWGINYTDETLIGILNSAGVKIAELDNNGIPVITINNETSITRIQNIYTKLFDSSYSGETLRSMKLDGRDALIFSDNRCLFLFTAFHTINALRAADVNFGIVPYPKYDKTQENYYPYTMGINIPWIVVPATNKDIENTAVFMEAFAYEGYKSVVPAFYDIILMGKLARDDESAEMLEYLYKNIRYDTGNLFNFGDFTSKLFGMANTADTNIVSMLEKNLPVLQKGIDQILEQIEKSE